MRLRLALGNVADQPADVAVRIAPAALVARSADLLLARAGPEIEAACRALHRESFPDGIPVGEAVITRGGDLLAPWLVHVVVPGYVVTHDRGYQLSAAYRACLREADSVGARTLAMPALGAWSPIWPLVDATRIGIGTLEGTITHVQDVCLVLPGASALEAFAEALARR